MKVLLDTHLFLWAAEESRRLPASVRDIMEGADQDLVFSVASLWEIAIKKALGRRDFRVDLNVLQRNLVENGYIELPVLAEHVLATVSQPPIHKDPFDRVLVAQATVEGIMLLTADPILARYPGPIRLV